MDKLHRKDFAKLAFNNRKFFKFTHHFQLKHSVLTALLVLATSGCVYGLCYYFLINNYELFIDMALNYAPQLVKDLERERMWFQSFSLAVLILSVFVGFVFGYRVSSRIIHPLSKLNEHILKTARGIWGNQSVQIRQDDDFHELIDNYNYFYSSLKINNQKDIKRINSIKDCVQETDLQDICKEIIDEKNSQIAS